MLHSRLLVGLLFGQGGVVDEGCACEGRHEEVRITEVGVHIKIGLEAAQAVLASITCSCNQSSEFVTGQQGSWGVQPSGRNMVVGIGWYELSCRHLGGFTQ